LPKELPTVLVCPLDWGLGHASRMIPVIHRFKQHGFQVMLGGSGKSGELLKTTFPDLPFIFLPSPVIRYGSGKLLIPKLLLQLPYLIWSVFREHRLVKKVIKAYRIDVLISDNRYGLFLKNNYCIFVTHQVSPVLPRIFRWLEYPVYLLIKSIIHQYDECWIPDWADAVNNLSGKLSHRFTPPRNARYIGILSRFNDLPFVQGSEPGTGYELAVVLSGPEPQVSILDNQIREQLPLTALRTIIISGMRENRGQKRITDGDLLTVVPHLPPQDLQRILSTVNHIICRSGYSGIMDLVALGKSACLIPTPGQPEQEYLAAYLSEKGLFQSVPQMNLNLLSAIARMKNDSPIKFNLPKDEPDAYAVFSVLDQKYHKDSQYSQ